MSTLILQDNSEFANSQSVTGSPAFVLVGNGIRFVNTERGRLLGSNATSAPIVVEGSGSIIDNLVGGIIGHGGPSYSSPPAPAILGGAGSDVVNNSGLIQGTVSLGLGNDTYRQFASASDASFIDSRIDLGGGDDLVELTTADSVETRMPQLVGGDGFDTLLINPGQNSTIYGIIEGMERVVFGNVSGMDNSFATAYNVNVNVELEVIDYSFIQLINSYSPSAVLKIDHAGVYIAGSSVFSSVIGTDAAESFSLGGSSIILNAVNLGGGDDYFGWNGSYVNTGGSNIPDVIDFGAGYDRFIYNTYFSPGTETVNLAGFAGLEELTDNGNQGAKPILFNHADGLKKISGNNQTITLNDSNSPAAYAVNYGGALTLEGQSTIYAYGYEPGGIWLTREQRAAVVSPALYINTTLTNSASILTDVELGFGDDLYDGRLGSVGGTVFGFAGNDILKGGVGAEILDGGYGADDLYGGRGHDTLIGGGGTDYFHGSLAELDGDTITDFSLGEKIHITDLTVGTLRYSLAGQVLSLNDANLNLGSTIGRIAVAADPDGGVDILLRKSVDYDFNGDGRSDILWRNVSGAVTTWLSTDGGVQGGPGGVAGQSWHAAGSGDFNGDGRADVLWRNDSGAITQWLSTGSDMIAGGFNHMVSANWKVAGVGDFNGDGRSGILWQNDNGIVTVWESTANGIESGFNAAANVGWKVAGVADFNGDGRDDVLWRHQNGSVTQWLSSSNDTFIGGPLNAFVDSNWSIEALGDVNGDSYADIMWRRSDGLLVNWQGTSTGARTTGAFNVMVDPSWHIDGVGDYDGDGRDDLLWRNDSGAFTDWLSTEAGYVRGALEGSVSTGWTIL